MTSTIALVHPPSSNLNACERTFVPHRSIDLSVAQRQHQGYCRVLADCGCEVIEINVNADLPDGVFIEDTAVVLDEVAVLGSMGADSRSAEPGRVQPLLRQYRSVEYLPAQARLEGGDVLRLGRTLLVGQSQRTNRAGIESMAAIVGRYGYQVTAVPVRDCLHLKTACTALADGRLLVNPSWVDERAIGRFPRLNVPESEPWAANLMPLGNAVVLSGDAPRTTALIESLGFTVHPVDLSEFAKAEGGVTCLALLIPLPPTA